MPMVMPAGKTVMPRTNILTENYTRRDVALHKNSETLRLSDSTLLEWKYIHVQHKQIHLLAAKVSHM